MDGAVARPSHHPDGQPSFLFHPPTQILRRSTNCLRIHHSTLVCCMRAYEHAPAAKRRKYSFPRAISICLHTRTSNMTAARLSTRRCFPRPPDHPSLFRSRKCGCRGDATSMCNHTCHVCQRPKTRKKTNAFSWWAATQAKFRPAPPACAHTPVRIVLEQAPVAAPSLFP